MDRCREKFYVGSICGGLWLALHLCVNLFLLTSTFRREELWTKGKYLLGECGPATTHKSYKTHHTYPNCSCVLVRDSTIVARGSNKTNETRNGTRHAEFIAIDKLIEKKGGLSEADFGSVDLYVTCEPCIMCAGAISLLGFKSVTFGCPNDKFGGNGSIISVHESGCGGCGKFEKMPAERQYMSRGGLFSDEAVAMLKDFYESGNPNGMSFVILWFQLHACY